MQIDFNSTLGDHHRLLLKPYIWNSTGAVGTHQVLIDLNQPSQMADFEVLRSANPNPNPDLNTNPNLACPHITPIRTSR